MSRPTATGCTDPPALPGSLFILFIIVCSGELTYMQYAECSMPNIVCKKAARFFAGLLFCCGVARGCATFWGGGGIHRGEFLFLWGGAGPPKPLFGFLWVVAVGFWFLLLRGWWPHPPGLLALEPRLLSACAESNQRHTKRKGDFDFPLSLGFLSP